MQKWAYLDKIDKEVGANNRVKCIVTIMADTEMDIPTADPAWLPGSMALVAESHKCRILNTEGAWK